MPWVLHRVIQLSLLIGIMYLGGSTVSDLAFKPTTALAGHTIGDPPGHCLYDPPLRNCWQNYGWNSSALLYYHVENQATGSPCNQSQWTFELETARSNWSSAPGPQIFSWGFPWQNMRWIYLQCWDNPPGFLGLTYRCLPDFSCVGPLNQATDTSYALVRLDPQEVTTSNVANAFAHELGHALGLHHHIPDGCTSLMYSFPCPSTKGPHYTIDLGAPGGFCGGPEDTWGIRCIYGWP